MKVFITSVVLIVGATMVVGQRPFFAGSKPIGYPELGTTEGLEDRFGEVEGTTQKLPIEANGDRDLIDRLSKLPIDNQPFWFINWQALEAHRQNPQTYPQRPSPFVPPNGSGNFGIGNTNFTTANTNNSGIPNSNTATSVSSGNSNSVIPSVASTNGNTENRFGTDNAKPTTAPNSQVPYVNKPNVQSNSGNKGDNVPNKQNYAHGKHL